MKNKPNLLFVFADQWRRQSVGFMGEEQVYTPQMDSFASEGLIFDNAISNCPLCSPFRASLFSGKHPLSTGVFTNCKIGLDIHLKGEEICIGDVLKEGGYNTGYIGKWHLDVPEQNYGNKPLSGAVNWDAYTPPGPKRQGFDFWYSYGADDHHLNPHYWTDSPEQIKINKWSVEHETDVAMDFINKQEGKPFALFLSYNPPHSPYDQVPQKYREIYEDKEIKLRPNVSCDKLMAHTGENLGSGKEELIKSIKNYYAAISGVDEHFGRILDELDRLGIRDNTIIVLTADHGDMMGSHGMMAKHVWYEESIGIPFVVNWRGKIRTGREKTIVNSADVMPTLLSLLELPIPKTVEGYDLAKVILEGNSKEELAAYICACPGRDIFLDHFKAAGVDPVEYGWRGIRTQRYTYVIFKGYMLGEKTQRLLYDNEVDPYQMNPTIVENTEDTLAKSLDKCLIDWLSATNDPFIKGL